MSILEFIKNQVDSTTEEIREIYENDKIKTSKGFIYWFFRYESTHSDELLRLDPVITDGKDDGGIDAFIEDDVNSVYEIYQFKYSEDLSYVMNGFFDLQRAVVDNVTCEKIKKARVLKLYLINICDKHKELEEESKRTETEIKNFLKKQEIEKEVFCEVYDLKKFSSSYERINGVNLSLSLKGSIKDGDTVYGLVCANDFIKNIERKELLDYNIRKYLGTRKGSVNRDILETLKNTEGRSDFSKLNNGIVCLCTNSDVETSDDYKELMKSLNVLKKLKIMSTSAYNRYINKLITLDVKKTLDRKYYTYNFENFTIVNGAQTVTTLCNFLKHNPTLNTEPVWIFCKIIKVNNTDIEKAQRYTYTSNNQTPASSKDLRAADSLHKILCKWFKEILNYQYIYTKGTIKERGNKQVVLFKEMSQAYVAYSLEEPHIAFNSSDAIFSSNDMYSKVFPKDEIDNLIMKGSNEEIKLFLVSRLVPVLILNQIRIKVRQIIKKFEGVEDLGKWRSAAFHILWLYKKLISLQDDKLFYVYENYKEIVDETVPDLFWEVHDKFQKKEIPKILKDSEGVILLGDEEFRSKSRMMEVKLKLKQRGILDSKF